MSVDINIKLQTNSGVPTVIKDDKTKLFGGKFLVVGF